MKKNYWTAAIVVVLLIIATVGYFVYRKPAVTPPASEPVETDTVTYGDSGFSPAAIIVNQGDRVTWKNNSSGKLWVASAQHPTHTVYPGSGIEKCGTPEEATIFDACKGIDPGGSYAFVFNEAGKWFYHNHLDSSKFGSVEVKEKEQAANIITYTDAGFSPATLQVKIGDTVTFLNNSQIPIWPASAQHPTHRLYPGSDIEKCNTPDEQKIFDACRAVAPAGFYSFTFNEVGKWSYHDHLNIGTRQHFGAVEVFETNSATLKNSGGLSVSAATVTYYEGVRGYLAKPAVASNYPGVVMIHEWWGLNDNIKQMADQLAKEGYVVLAVDLFGGKVATTSEGATANVRGINQAEAIENMKGAIALLKSEGATKLAALGWCFGGGQSLQLSLSGEPLVATVLYYGTPLVTDAEKLKSISWPVLGIFGDKDAAIPVDTINQFKSALDGLKITEEIYVYPGLGHAFANPSGANYAANETRDAWQKTVAFLNKAAKNQ